MNENRVCFDFEVIFSNGGGLQGQGFRLDMEGTEIIDKELEAYIIKDLRLLMVGEIRILNKKIIKEAHKRSSSIQPTILNASEEQNEGNIFVDLSHTITDGLITYKGLPAPIICDHMSHIQSHDSYEEGTEFQIGRIDMVANTGTYIDAPYHRFPKGHDLSEMTLERLSNLPAVVVRLRGHENRAIDWTSFAATDVAGHAVLVETGWSDHWRTDAYFENHPFLTQEAANYLRDQGAILVGIDSLNIDDTSGGSRPVHTALLGAEIPIVEHLCNLSALPETGFTFSAAPPKIEKMGTFPVRAHAWL